MNIPHTRLSVDINRRNHLTVDLIGHVNDKNTRYLDLQLTANNEVIELEQGCTATVTYTSDNVLIDQDVECDVNGNVIEIGFDSEKVEHARSGILAIQPKITDTNDNVLTLQIPIYVRVSADIAQSSQIYDDSRGTYAEVVQEIAAARGSYQNLKARLDDTGAPTDEQVAEAVEGYIDNHQEAIVKKAIIANTEMLSPDITFEANNDDVNDYLTASAYVFAADNAYNSNDYQSTNVPADIGSSVNERPNHGTVTIPEGGAKITLIDTVAKIKWSESVSGGDYEVKNLIPNRLYTYVIKNSSGAVIKTGSCKTSGQVRIIDAGKAVTYPVSDPTTTSERPLFNIRDLGGWACDGGRLKYGLIYRGCRLNGSYTNNNSVRYGISITESQKAFFKNFLGIRDEIDLRQIKNDPDSGNTETAGDDAIYGTPDDITDTALGVGVDYAIYPIKPYYAGMLSGNAVQNSRYAAIINRIAYDIKNSKPCYVHCLEGADRTGMIAMLILGICGVSRSDIERDYELTSFSKDYIGNRNRRARNDSALSYRWMTLMQHLLGNTTGSTFRDKIIDYVIKIGVTVNEINTIRAGLIDGSPEKIKSPYADAAIQYNLTNIITDNPISSIALYQPLEVKLTALNMTDIQSVTVMMGGTDITSTAYNAERILIPKVTGDITITASATDVVIPDVSGKADKATTLAGYGITNAYTKAETDDAIIMALNSGNIGNDMDARLLIDLYNTAPVTYGSNSGLLAMTNGYYNANGQIIDHANYKHTDIIEVIPGTTLQYTNLRAPSSSTPCIVCFEDGVYSSGDSFIPGNTDYASGSFSIPSNINGIALVSRPDSNYQISIVKYNYICKIPYMENKLNELGELSNSLIVDKTVRFDSSDLTWENGYISKTDGSITAHGRYHASELIEVIEGTTVTYQNLRAPASSYPQLACYTANDRSSYLPSASLIATGTDFACGTFTVPAGVKYISICVYDLISSSYPIGLEIIEKANRVTELENTVANAGFSQWSGKLWYAFGTSITSTNNTLGENNTPTGKYPAYLCQMSGLLLYDHGIAGGTIGSGGIHGGTSNILNEIKATDLSDADLITIEGFVNDFACAVSLGELGDTEATTMYGAITQAVSYCLQHSNATVVLITESIGRSYNNADYRTTRKNSLNLTQNDYNEVIRQAGKYLGVPVIDAGAKSQINEYRADYLYDHIHHSELGGKQYAAAIWDELKNIHRIYFS